MKKAILIVLVLLALVAPSQKVRANSFVTFKGVNLAGAEFGTSMPGTYGVDYIYPHTLRLITLCAKA